MDKNDFVWLFTPETTQQIHVRDKQEFFESMDLFHAILDSIQDGVSVLDTNFHTLYMNASLRHIYAESDVIGHICYRAYHHLKTHCDRCPALRAIQTKQPQTDIIAFEGIIHGWHQLYAIPLLDSDGNVFLIIEYARDITLLRAIEENLNELTSRFEALEKQNEILRQILIQREQYQAELEQTISTNVERFIKPSLAYLKKSVRQQDVELVTGLIDEIIYPITKKRPDAAARLTPREMQVAALIKEGHTSKEIADQLCVTAKAVDFHRANIRKKLNLSRETNLRSYLETQF